MAYDDRTPAREPALLSRALPARTNIDAAAAVWAGLIAGILMMVLEMVMAPLFLGVSAWMPPRMIAAMVLGQDVLTTAGFDMGVMMMAMAIHIVLSILFAYGIALLVNNLARGAAAVMGALAGFGIYALNFWIMTGIFEWFAGARNWVTLFTHIAFGAMAAWSYKALAHPVPEHELSQPTTLRDDRAVRRDDAAVDHGDALPA